jgi:hypothetical protein
MDALLSTRQVPLGKEDHERVVLTFDGAMVVITGGYTRTGQFPADFLSINFCSAACCSGVVA